MSPLLLFITLRIFLAASSPWETIWSDGMNETDGGRWSYYTYYDYDFAVDDIECPDSPCLKLSTSLTENSLAGSMTNVTKYAQLRLLFDLVTWELEGGDLCTVYYKLDSKSWKYLRVIKNDGLFRDLKTVICSSCDAERLQISLEIEADSNSGNDRCYYDNVRLQGVVKTKSPTTHPTYLPTQQPSANPTLSPTVEPTIEPTMNPTTNPVIVTTVDPTMIPTINPTMVPSIDPTMVPTFNPSMIPTINPTMIPTINPTLNPSIHPTLNPSIDPTMNPTVQLESAGVNTNESNSTSIVLILLLPILTILFLGFASFLVYRWYTKQRERKKVAQIMPIMSSDPETELTTPAISVSEIVKKYSDVHQDVKVNKEDDETDEDMKDLETEEMYGDEVVVNGEEDAEKVLKLWGLEQYIQVLIVDEGYEDIADWKKLTLDDLMEMGFKKGHAAKFMRKVFEHFDDQEGGGADVTEGDKQTTEGGMLDTPGSV